MGLMIHTHSDPHSIGKYIKICVLLTLLTLLTLLILLYFFINFLLTFY